MVIHYTRPPQARRDALLPTARPQVRKNRRRTLWGTWRIFRTENEAPEWTPLGAAGVGRMRKRHFQLPDHRSHSPMTMSYVPKIVTASAIM